MPGNVLLDTNVVIALFAGSEPFCESSSEPTYSYQPLSSAN